MHAQPAHRHPQFTAEILDQEVKSFEHATFVYRFKPHENFDLRDFGFQLNVNYIDSNEAPFRHTPFNSTVQFVFLLTRSTCI